MYTLKDFMNISFLNKSKLMTTHCDTDSIQIAHISVMELPVEDFIRKNELILTTAIGCYDDIDVFLEYVTEIYLSKAAVLAVSRKENDYYIPQEILDFADSVGFPIIMIPWECKFGEIIEEVIYKIKGEHDSKISLYENMEKQLLLNYINSHTLADAAQVISELFLLPVIITDEFFKIKGYSRSFLSKPKLEESSSKYNKAIKLILNKKLYGYIFFVSDSKIDNLEELDNFINKFAITPLTLWFDKEETINTTILKLKNDFVWSLISNTADNYNDFVLDGKRLGFTIKAPYTCIICKVTNKRDNVFDDGVYLNEWSIGNIIWESSKKDSNTVMFGLRNDKVVIFLRNSHTDCEQYVERYIKGLEEKLTVTFAFYDFYWGISEILNESANFRELYHNAMFALNLCVNSKHINLKKVTYKETIVYKIISDLSKNEEQRVLAERTLAPLVDKTKPSSCNMLETLKVYIENNYNTSKTARDLNIHRQSLLYRLEKIEELTSMSLYNHTDLYVLETYLRLVYKF